MDKLRIVGGNQLNGSISISGAKNASLPLLAAGILTNKKLTLKNVPQLQDIKSLLTLFESLGIKSTFENGCVVINAAHISNTKADYELVSKMRASILVLGPLLAREGHAEVSMPGGCAIGVRPIDLHLKGLEALGAKIELNHGYVEASAPNGLIGGLVNFNKQTVTGTENILMAATLAKGHTTILNAACEPEIVDLANCLIKMGAKITGQGTPTINVEGVNSLHDAEYSVISDRIELGTYILTVAMTKGHVKFTGTKIDELVSPLIPLYTGLGLKLHIAKDQIDLTANQRLQSVDIETKPFPGFPTDLQAQLMAAVCLADGTSTITESIWENRFMHAAELARMGADISIKGSSAIIRPIDKFLGANVMATDLRASFSLLMAGLAAEGETVISRIYHLDRGYEFPERKLSNCGAVIERIKGEQN